MIPQGQGVIQGLRKKKLDFALGFVANSLGE